MRFLKFLPVILVGLTYFVMSPILKERYPLAESDCDQYGLYWTDKSEIIEAMLAGLFLTLFLNTKGLLKSIACGFLILTVSSFIDKAIYNITWYLKSDIPLVVLSLIISIYVYVREGKRTPE